MKQKSAKSILPPIKKKKFDVDEFVKAALKAKKVFEEEEKRAHERKRTSEIAY